MKRILAVISLALMSGCSAVKEVTDEITNAPPTFWQNLKDAVLFIFGAIVNGLTQWLHMLFGMGS